MNKSVLREIFQKKRKSLTVDEKYVLDLAIHEGVLNCIRDNRPKLIHLFLPQKGSMEPDLQRLIPIIRNEAPQTRFAAPFIIPGTKVLANYYLEADSILTDNKWGIPEPDPTRSKPVDNQDIDLVLLPLLAFDLRGYRVGYGGGYYDRFLTHCRPEARKVGISLFDPVQRIDDINAFDIRMDHCICPTAVYNWR